MKLKYPLIAALAAFIGCTQIPSIGPDYEEPTFEIANLPLPDAGRALTNLNSICEYEVAASNEDDRIVINDQEIAQWWKRFNDPILENLVTSAVSNNVSYRMAITRLEQSKWELFGSYAAFIPQFDVGALWNRGWFNKETASNPTGQNGYNYNVVNTALDGVWEIDIFGGNRRLTEAAIARWEASGMGVSDAWLALTTQVGKQYVNLRTCQERISVARTNLVLQSETYEILKSRLNSGIGDQLAVNQCAYIVEQTRSRIPTLLAEEERIKNSLAILVGEIPGSLEETLRPLSDRHEWLLEPQRVAELPLDLIRARPDVKRAERELAAQTARIGAAKAQWFPKLYITGSVGWEAKNGAQLFSRDSFFALLGPAISWPIFQGGAIYANVKATEAKTREMALAYEQAIQNAYGEVRNSYTSYTQEYHRFQSLQGAVKAATDAVTISQDLYKNGLKDFNNVLDAQRSRLELEEQMVLSRGLISTDLIELYKTLGGGLATTR